MEYIISYLLNVFYPPVNISATAAEGRGGGQLDRFHAPKRSAFKAIYPDFDVIVYYVPIYIVASGHVGLKIIDRWLKAAYYALRGGHIKHYAEPIT